MSKTKEVLLKDLEEETLKYPFAQGPVDQEEIFVKREEVIEINNGKYKTTIKIQFNNEGFPIAVLHQADVILNKNQQEQNQLEFLIAEAVKNKDFIAADSMQKQLERIQFF